MWARTEEAGPSFFERVTSELVFTGMKEVFLPAQPARWFTPLRYGCAVKNVFKLVITQLMYAIGHFGLYHWTHQ